MKKIIDFLKLFQDFGIDYATEGMKQTRDGWVQVSCPFCSGAEGYHLGYNLRNGYFNCWRCGFHSTYETINAIFGDTAPEVFRTLPDYGKGLLRRPTAKSRGLSTAPSAVSLPAESAPLGDRGKRYLDSRGFDPEWLEEMYGIQETGPSGDYKFRVIIPITLDDKLVSFQGRDYTGKAPLKYKACNSDKEVVPHRSVLYGEQFVSGKTLVVTEGVFDCWRMGPGCVAAFGIDYSNAQIKRILQYDRIAIMLDKDPPVMMDGTPHIKVEVPHKSEEQQSRLCDLLLALKKDVLEIKLEQGDPAELPQDDANALMREITGKKYR